ncbi:MAG: hypothetical protein DRJ01_07515 [Bacteroidetes bacterium]|nr:MAG: hypothetical protein DRJ01_07515 [Bacteroidota bacterium]
MEFLSIWDIVLTPVYLTIIFLFANRIKQKNRLRHPEYNFYTWGLLAKVFGAISVCVIYTVYYDGGDTTAYFKSAVALGKLLFKSPSAYLSIFFGNLTPENYSFFDSTTGWPYFYNDPKAFGVVRFVSLFTVFGFRCFYLTSILVAVFTYIGMWRLYRFFYMLFPRLKKEFALSVLFVPSVIFWGSGILKDSFTLSAAAWLTYSFYKIFIKKEKIISNVIVSFICIYVLISLKPYIFFSLLVAMFIWLTFNRLHKIKSFFIRAIMLPFFIIIIWGGGSYLIFQIGSTIGGDYSSIDKILEKAQITQDDLKREYYQGNSFDIGSFEPTLIGVIKKSPEAIVAGLYRPFIWESRNPVMLLSGVENFLLLILTFYVVFRSGLFFSFKLISKDTVILFCFIFSITFAFSVGLSTSNFGALVRYKIPAIPFFLAGLFIINYRFNRQNKQKTKKDNTAIFY